MTPPEGLLQKLKLGHIVYSNCFPVHARLLDSPRSGDPRVVEGVPATLNRLLADRSVDVAPASSIEYALRSDQYRLLPDLVIGSRGPVRSIILVSTRPPDQLDGALVAVPTASATSVVLLKILFRVRWGATPNYRWFDQSSEDPIAAGAAAALFIGDVALRPSLHSGEPVRLDLGEEWWDETRLPFAFALWQVSAPGADGALRGLHSLLLESREYGSRERSSLAARYASRFAMTPLELEGYWNELAFELDSEMVEGLQTFYRLACEIGEIARTPELHFI